MSSWVELVQRHKNDEKIEIKERLMNLKTKIKRLELSFKDTLESLNCDMMYIPQNTYGLDLSGHNDKAAYIKEKTAKEDYKENSLNKKNIQETVEDESYPLKPIIYKPIIHDNYVKKKIGSDCPAQLRYKEYLKESRLKLNFIDIYISIFVK